MKSIEEYAPLQRGPTESAVPFGKRSVSPETATLVPVRPSTSDVALAEKNDITVA